MRDETLADAYASNVTGAQYDAGMKNLIILNLRSAILSGFVQKIYQRNCKTQ